MYQNDDTLFTRFSQPIFGFWHTLKQIFQKARISFPGLSAYIFIHEHIMAEASRHNKNMKYLVSSEISRQAPEYRKLKRIYNSAYGIEQTACKEPAEGLLREGRGPGENRETTPARRQLEE